MTSLLRLMAVRGHTDLTAAHLMFLSNLDCGDTYASEVARRLGVSRQAVYRSTRELQRLKVLKLEIDADRKTQKIIRMTKHGQQVVLDARSCLDTIEAALGERIGTRDLLKLASILGKDWGTPLGDT
jgi:DNA-binding MarR family transcriptional regulator